MPSIQFSDILNRDKGKTGLVLGLGPSLRRHIDQIKHCQHDKENYKIISCNNIDRQTDLNFDYWMLAQPADSGSAFSIPNAHKRYNSRPGTMFLYTDCLDLTPRGRVAELLSNIEYIGYDQRHWKGEPCGWGQGPMGRHTCCDGIIPGRLTIQEELQQFTGMDEHYGAGDTVSVHMLALGVMLGLNPIYVTGVDLDYSGGYMNNSLPETKERTNMGLSSINKSPVMVDRILSDIALIRKSAEKIGTKIYCMDDDLKISKALEYKNLRNVLG